MVAASKKLKFTAEEKRSLLGGGSEPKIVPEKYTSSMMSALNWYNANTDRKTRTKYGIDYAKKFLKIDVSDFEDSDFITYGFLARLVSRGEPVSETDIQKLNTHILDIRRRLSLDEISREKEPVAVVPKPQRLVVDVNQEQANILIEEIEHFIDSNLYIPGTFEFPEDFFKKIQNPKAAKIVQEFFQSRLKEIALVRDAKDEQLNEGYSFLNRRKINHYTKFLESVVSSASTQAAVAKVSATRKPRAKKVKPASVIAKSLRFLAKDDTLSIESVKPELITGSTHVVLFHTKRRALVVVEALEGQTLSIKGTTIINNDPEKTLSKKIRKPETMLKDFIKATKRGTAFAFKSIKTTENKTATRTAEETLILAVNK